MNIIGSTGQAPTPGMQGNSTGIPSKLASQIADVLNEIIQLSEVNTASGGSAKIIGKAQSQSKQTTKTAQAREASAGEELTASAALIEEDDTEIRRKRKEKKLKERLKELMSQLENINTDNLSLEDQKVVKQFQEYSQTINNLESELKKLEDQENRYQNIIKDNERKKK